MIKAIFVSVLYLIFCNSVHAQNDKTDTPVEVVQKYFEFLGKGQYEQLMDLFDTNVIWQQPGNNRLSGIYYGKAQINKLFSNFMIISQNSFRIDTVEEIIGHGNLVIATLEFSARRSLKFEFAIKMKGIDVMKVIDGKIVEVVLFSEDQSVEDRFWGPRKNLMVEKIEHNVVL